jgi:hypothetical protein
LGQNWEKGYLTYLDDIFVFSMSLFQHLERLLAVFQRLQRTCLKLTPAKCHFAKDSVNYLGHIVSSEGGHSDPDKIRDMMEFPTPSDAAEVKRFL